MCPPWSSWFDKKNPPSRPTSCPLSTGQFATQFFRLRPIEKASSLLPFAIFQPWFQMRSTESIPECGCRPCPHRSLFLIYSYIIHLSRKGSQSDNCFLNALP